jgi:hypothetical protein
MALTVGVSRDILAPGPPSEVYKAALSVAFKQGSIVAIDTADGLLKLGAVSTTLKVLGVSCVDRDTTGMDADDPLRWIPVEHGTLGWFASDTDADLIEADDIKKDCYLVDDDTVALTSDTNARSRAGTIHKVDPDTGLVAVQFEVVR